MVEHQRVRLGREYGQAFPSFGTRLLVKLICFFQSHWPGLVMPLGLPSAGIYDVFWLRDVLPFAAARRLLAAAAAVATCLLRYPTECNDGLIFNSWVHAAETCCGLAFACVLSTFPLDALTFLGSSPGRAQLYPTCLNLPKRSSNRWHVRTFGRNCGSEVATKLLLRIGQFLRSMRTFACAAWRVLHFFEAPHKLAQDRKSFLDGN